MTVKLGEFVSWIEKSIPPALQDHYDNSGLQTGDPGAEVRSILLTLDVTPEVIDEAITLGCDLVLSHHPLIFTPLKRITGGSDTEVCVARALKNGIAVYSAHTSFDNLPLGVSHALAERLGLENIRVLSPAEGLLSKIVTFVPLSHADKVRNALFDAGAGHIGNYDRCSFNVSGEGTFRAGEGADPYAGSAGSDHTEPEIRIEAVVPSYLVNSSVRALIQAHPYEEPAYDIIPLRNSNSGAGAGASGTLPEPMTGSRLMKRIKEVTGVKTVRYSGDPERTVTRVALCGGAGSHLMQEAARAGADAFLTGDIKYHTFTSAPRNMLVADIGHHESEKLSLEVLYNLINKKFPNFALRFSEINTNPINYF